VKTRTLRHDTDAQGSEPRCLALVGRPPRGRGIVVELGARTTIGRAPDCDVVVDDDGVSRHHACLEIDAEGNADVVDLESKNGTRVNGGAITRERLRPGDLVEVGSIRLELLSLAPAELAQARRTARAWQVLADLSARELEVAQLVAAGMKSAEIGDELGITTRTVNTHLERVFERLEIRSRTVLARMVIEAGLLEPDA
jgi:DNA-binding CsgD family transcriptional regulator